MVSYRDKRLETGVLRKVIKPEAKSQKVSSKASTTLNLFHLSP